MFHRHNIEPSELLHCFHYSVTVRNAILSEHGCAWANSNMEYCAHLSPHPQSVRWHYGCCMRPPEFASETFLLWSQKHVYSESKCALSDFQATADHGGFLLQKL